MRPRRLVLGTRGSLLAQTQTGHVRDRLLAAAPGLEVETVLIRTQGDHLQQHPLAPGKTLPKGLFTGALEEALAGQRIDVAVHSMKDLPTELGGGLVVAAVPERVDARDAFLSNGPRFADLPTGARIATGSPRRVHQLARLRADLEIVPVRGNVDSRIAKLRAGEFEGLVLAAAGLARLGRQGDVVEFFPADRLLPAPGQGALAVEMRAGPEAEWVASVLDDAGSRAAVTAERAVLIGVGGGCSLPLGTHAEATPGRIQLRAVLFSADGSRCGVAAAVGPLAGTVGQRVAEDLLKQIEGECPS